MRPPTSVSSSLVLSQGCSAWRHSVRSLCQVQRYRTYSTPSNNPLIKVQSIPAPHIGLITILSLASPANKNAISQQLLHELAANIEAIYNQWDTYSSREKELGREKARKEAEQTQEQSQDWAGSDLPGGALIPRDLTTASRVLVLNSEVNGVFCAGADLKERAGMSLKETRQFLEKLRHTLGRLACLPIPTISAISGFALGGGLELALSTTFRVLSTTSVVGLPETRLGIIPGAGGPMRLEDLVGSRKAADLILTGRRINGKEAFAMSLCERLVDESETQSQNLDSREQKDHTTLATALKMANEICEGAPIAIGAASRCTLRGLGSQNPRAFREEQMYERVVTTEDRDEALIAFKEKRKPIFKGR